uniref:Regulator of microtubule dynamics protein 1 n=1 Tax=Timema genevievae TaxID=629358 RepID=A0A7R9JNE4_TIMGE|nr:unnamed protein product [Timema genevievae]
MWRHRNSVTHHLRDTELSESITDMPWYQRQIARTFFATPPTSTYEEALQFFSKAEEVDPQFYSQNLLMLGKTYLRINDLENARHYLYLASTYPTHTDDDIKFDLFFTQNFIISKRAHCFPTSSRTGLMS